MEVMANDANFEEEVLQSDIAVLVDFWAPWCGPCHMIAPAVEDIAREYQGRLKVVKLNVDEAPGVASRYGIMSIPTLIVFKGGKVAGQSVGVLSRSAIAKMVEPHCNA